jgi:hypothetical protein
MPTYERLDYGSADGCLIGGAATDKIGLYGKTPAVQGSALTTQLTTITPADAEGTPDYAIAGVTNSTAYGFASAQEAITTLYVIKNLQVRLAEVEARLETIGLVAAN